MPAIHTERCFETAIEDVLLSHGYVKHTRADFDEKLALFPADVIAWVKASQPQTWARVAKHFKTEAEAERQLIGDLDKALKDKTGGCLHVLRNGFKCYGQPVRMAAFAPATTLNQETQAQYRANICAIARQIPCQPGKGDTVDVVLAVNGLPVVTMELKNPLTGQTFRDAQRQYEVDRSPEAPLFRFKERALVHFAVDTEEARLCTRLARAGTRWLPFNQGHDNGAGNPPAAGQDYKTGYLWNDVLARESLLDLLARFLHLEKKEKKGQGGRPVTQETLIFPRFHQLTSVRRLVAHARDHGPGHNYLVQHSAGSGKSNTIGWLAHQLASLHDRDNRKVFNSVIVVTDRLVIDSQLQETVNQFEQTRGVVRKIDKDTAQLAQALAEGAPIIVSTIQKFPFIAQALRRLASRGQNVEIETAGKSFAVIVDEAHSNQSGETATELKKLLNGDGIEADVAAQLLEESGTIPPDGEDQKARAEVLRQMAARAKQPNLSYFAFTATPKFKTLAVFDEPGANGRAPFHLYSMKQAIQEGFILDVLAHYVPYKLYYKLVQGPGEADPKVPKRKGLKALADVVKRHPHNIREKTEILIEHLRNVVMPQIGGRAKAMLVVDGREMAARYKLAVDNYLLKKNYAFKALVAFSGDVGVDGQKYTEPGMNGGLPESQLPGLFDTSDAYRLLIAADKYQTGFDQPLLQTMYVDKKLSGIQAVQALSRLNRTAPGKVATCVIDFLGQRDEIFAAFKPYYEEAEVGEMPEPQRLEALKTQLFAGETLRRDEVNDYCRAVFGSGQKQAESHKRINSILDKAAARYGELDEDKQELFHGQLSAFVKLYAFLSQILPYGDEEWERLYAYGTALLKKIAHPGQPFKLGDTVALQYYRLHRLEEEKIALDSGDNEPLKGPTDTGTGQGDEPEGPLSELVNKLNERFGTEFNEADRVFLEQVSATAVQDEVLRQAARVNPFDAFTGAFFDRLDGLFVKRVADNAKILQKVMDDASFRRIVSDYLAKDVYARLNGGRA